MDRNAVLEGGLVTGVAAIVVGLLVSLPNILPLGLIGGFVTGYRTESWSDEFRDGAAAGALGGVLTLAALGGIGYFYADAFGSVSGFLFVAIPLFAIEGGFGALAALRFA
jgi:hypothetical protein